MTLVTLRRIAAAMVLAALPGVALATTFTDNVSGANTMQVVNPPLGGIGTCYLLPGSHPYAARTLTTNNTTEYTFSVTSVSGLGNDPFLAVYAGTFNPADPNQNLVSCNDDYNGLLSQFSATLSAGATYVIVTTAYSPGQTGSATYGIGPDVTLAGAPVLSAVSVSGVTINSAVLQGTSSSAGTGYFVVQPATEAAPTVAQVIAGQQSTGAAALVAGNGVVAANTPVTFPLAPLNAGTGYIAYLVARDNQNPQLSSVPGTASFTTVAVAPQAPTIGTATAGDAQASVTFTAPADNGGSVVNQYIATSSPGNITATGATSPIVVPSLTNGIPYTFTVTATNSIGTGPASAPSNAVTPIGPAVLGAFGPFTNTFGDAPVTLTPPSSPSAGAFTYTSSNPAVASISGDVVTIVSAGTSTITANQAADGAFTPGSTSATLTVDKAAPAITGFNDLASQFGDSPLTLADPASNSAAAFSYASSDPAVATVSGNIVTIVGAGTASLTATQAATANYLAGSAVAQLTVSTAAPALGAFGDLARTFNDPDFTLVAPSSNSAGAFTYTSSNPAVATVAGDLVTIIGAGTTTLTASQAAGGNYSAAQTTAQLTVGAAAPVLSGFNDRTATFGDAPLTLTAPASPSAGVFTYTSSNPAAATISGNVVSIVGSGSATITATQAADGNYAAAQTTAQLTVGVAAPALSGFNDLSATFGDAPITLTAPTSPSAGVFTYTSSNPAVATISGNVVTILASGSATITAAQAAEGNYAAAQIPAQLTVGLATPALTAFSNLNATFGDAPITLTAPSSPSAGAFTYASGNPAVTTVSGNVVTIVGSGSVVITATQAADGNYAAAQTTAQLTVGVAAPVLSGFNNLSATFGDAPITLVAPTSPSAGAFTYSSSNPAVATISGNAVTITGAGSASLTATQAADGNYATAQTTAQLVVGVAAPALSGFNNLTATFGDAPITLTAPTSPSAGAFTYGSSNPAVATISGNVVTIIGSGTTTITAIQAANGNYAPAQTTAQLLVDLAAPALAGFNDFTATFGDAPITLIAPTSPSAGVFTYTSSNPAVATISGNVVTITGSGSSTITAIETANGNYSSAQTTAQLVVGLAAPALAGFNNLNAIFGDAPITLTAPTSPSAGVFTYTSSNPAVATISGNVVTITGSGTTTITATQAANGSYAGAQTTAQLVVGLAAPTLNGFDDLTATFGDAPITLVAPTSPSTGAFTYTSSDPAVATISGNVVTITGSGTATITATQAANGSYAGAQAMAQLVVGVAAPTLSGFDDLEATFGDQPITLTAPVSASVGTFTYSSSNPEVATISGNVVTIVAAGTTTLTATQAANGSYAGASITAQLVVGMATPTITGFADLHKVIGQAAFDLVDPTSNSEGAFAYTIDNAAIATVSGRTVTITGAGTATITATQAATANYSAASVTALLVVDSRPDPTKDAEVVGSLQAQMDAALRFATAQQTNVRDRLRQRRATDAAGRSNGLSVNANGGNGGVALQPELLDEAGEGSARQGWSLWTGGAISTGDRDYRTGSDRYDFRSDGVTVGADTRIGKDMLLGVAVGGGWSDIDVGSNGSRVDARQRALTVYGLWHGAGSLFVDGQLAVGKLDYDLRRWSTIADTMANGQREGSQVFGSVTFGYEKLLDNSRLTTYGRVDAGRSTLDAYRETGLGIYDLQYREQTVQQRSVAIGVEGSHSVKVDWARDVRPYWQLEYRNDFSDRSDAAINYVVAPADDDYRLALQPWVSSNWNVGFGADFAFGNGVIVTALVRHELNVGMGANTTFGLQFSLDFGDSRSSGGSGGPVVTDGKAAGKKK